MSHRWTIRIVVSVVMCLCSTGCGGGPGTSGESVPLVVPSPGAPTATGGGPGSTVATPTCQSAPTDSPSVSPPQDVTPTPRPSSPLVGLTQTATPGQPDALSCAALGKSLRPRPDFPPSIPNPENCVGGYNSSNYASAGDQPPIDAAEELHVIGVYEGRGAEHGSSSDGHVAGVVEVVVRPRPKPVVLALSSYEPVRWRISAEPGAVVSRIVVQGYYPQEVEGVPAGATVRHAEACGCMYGWEVAHNQDGCSYAVEIAAIRQLTGLDESSFQGCYAGDRFEIPYWSGEPPAQRPTPIAGDETLAPSAVPFPGCELVTAESEYCLTFAERGISLLGLDSGTLCPVTTTTANVLDGYADSIAWRGELLYTCNGDGLIRISLRDGAWEAAQVSCQAVTDFDGGLLLMSSLADPGELGVLRAYRNYQAILDQAEDRIYNFGAFATRMTVHGDRYFGAWHATDSIDVGDLSTGAVLGVLTLERDDDWVWGMAVTHADELVLANGRDRVELFDSQTGAKLRELPFTERIAGLACTSRRALPEGTPTPAPTPQSPTPTESLQPRPTSIPSCEELDRLVSEPGQRANFPPSVEIAKNCGPGGYSSSNYATPDSALAADAPVELHVVGVYEGAADAGFRSERQGVVTITVRPRPKPVVLVLESVEPTRWHIRLVDGARLERVITQGYSSQSVDGVPDHVPVEHRGPGNACALAYGWELWNGGGYPLMIADLRAYTGLVETSFQGCYAGVEFDVPYWDDAAPPTEKPTPLPLNESIAREDVVFPGCETVSAEHQYCLTTTYGGPALVGLDTGTVCPLGSRSPVGFDDLTSIAWRGEALYACSYEAGLVRISLRDGTAEFAQVPCAAVTDHGGSLLLLSSDVDPLSDLWDALYEYPSYAAILRGAHTAIYDSGGAFEEITVHGDTLYGAWHSTDSIDVVDLASRTPRPPIALQGYDGWILGLSVTDGGQLVISGDTWGNTVRIFDANTGDHIRDIHPSTPVSGLSCIRRRSGD